MPGCSNELSSAPNAIDDRTTDIKDVEPDFTGVSLIETLGREPKVAFRSAKKNALRTEPTTHAGSFTDGILSQIFCLV